MVKVADLDAAHKARDEARSLQLISQLRNHPVWSWDLLVRIPDFWEHSEEVAQAAYQLACTLGDRGIEVTPFVQSSLRKLRGGSTPRAVKHAQQFLRHGIEKWRAQADWRRVDWSLYASDLVELLKEECRPLMFEILRLALEHDGEKFATSLTIRLFTRWTELGDEVHAQLRRDIEPLAPGLLEKSERKQPELSPLSAEEVLNQIADAPPPYVVAAGNISPVPGKSTRCLFYRIDGVNLVPLCDLWVANGEIPMVLERLRKRGATWQASCDAMYATYAERIWIDDPFTYWENHKRRIWREGDILYCDTQRVPITALLRVEAYLEQGWILRGVRLWLRKKDGSEYSIKLAEVEDHISEIDPTYDGINISFETEWAVTMARAISKALHVPLEKDEAMF